jgi:hypothetical protein
MLDEPCVGFLDVEGIAIVGDDNVGLVKNPV